MHRNGAAGCRNTDRNGSTGELWNGAKNCRLVANFHAATIAHPKIAETGSFLLQKTADLCTSVKHAIG